MKQHQRWTPQPRSASLAPFEACLKLLSERFTWTATKSDADQHRNLIRVVDLCDGVDAGRETRCAHQRHRADPTEEGAGAQADSGLLPVDRQMADAAV